MNAVALARRDADVREEVTRLGLWMFLGTVTMLFAAFSSAYLVRKSGSDWSRTPLPDVLWVNTIVLALSSAALEWAARAGIRGRQLLARAGITVAVVLGFAFLAGQWEGWRHLQAAGIYLPGNPSSSFFYVLTGAHAVHVIAGLIVLFWGAAITWRGDPIANARSWTSSMGLCRTFWHFLLGVWLYVFAFISLV